MLVPTIITPGEWKLLINPLHPQFSLTWIVTGPDVYAFDARLLPVQKETRSRRTSRRQLRRESLENSGQKVDMDASAFCKSLIIGAPYGIRTRVTALRGPRFSPGLSSAILNISPFIGVVSIAVHAFPA